MLGRPDWHRFRGSSVVPSAWTLVVEARQPIDRNKSLSQYDDSRCHFRPQPRGPAPTCPSDGEQAASIVPTRS